MQMQRVETTCPIVGIVERETGPFAGGGGGLGADDSAGQGQGDLRQQSATAQALLRDPARTSRPYQSAVVKVTSPQATQDVQEQIKKMGFSAFSLNDALQGAKRGFIILDIVLSLIGSIALAVSSLGIMNTMVMSILERTREIGIMKAIGGSDGDIRRIFLIEASAIGFFGGVAGVALGLGRRPHHQLRRQHLHPAAGGHRRQPLLAAVLADRRRDRLLDRDQPAGRQLSGRARREARSDPGVTT